MLLESIYTGKISSVLIIVPECFAKFSSIIPLLCRRSCKLVTTPLKSLPVPRTTKSYRISARTQIIPSGVSTVDISEWVAELVNLFPD